MRRGAESVILGNLLASGRTFRTQGRVECERKSEVGLQGSDSFVFVICREPQRGEAPRLRLQEDALEYILEVGTRRT